MSQCRRQLIQLLQTPDNSLFAAQKALSLARDLCRLLHVPANRQFTLPPRSRFHRPTVEDYSSAWLCLWLELTAIDTQPGRQWHLQWPSLRNLLQQIYSKLTKTLAQSKKVRTSSLSSTSTGDSSDSSGATASARPVGLAKQTRAVDAKGRRKASPTSSSRPISVPGSCNSNGSNGSNRSNRQPRQSCWTEGGAQIRLHTDRWPNFYCSLSLLLQRPQGRTPQQVHVVILGLKLPECVACRLRGPDHKHPVMMQFKSRVARCRAPGRFQITLSPVKSPSASPLFEITAACVVDFHSARFRVETPFARWAHGCAVPLFL
jgi:hypothetical protein